MSRRLDVKSNNVLEFLDKGRVAGELELAPAMRRQTVGAPNPLYA